MNISKNINLKKNKNFSKLKFKKQKSSNSFDDNESNETIIKRLEKTIKSTIFDENLNIDNIQNVVVSYLYIKSQENIIGSNKKIKEINSRRMKNLIQKKFFEKEKLHHRENIKKFEILENNFKNDTKEIIKNIKETKQNIYGTENENEIEEYQYDLFIFLDQYTHYIEYYTNITIGKSIFRGNICDNCGEDIEHTVFFEGIEVCPNCNTGIIKIKSQKSETENYERNNFFKSLRQLQGIQGTNSIPKNIEERLDDYFVSIGMKTGREVRRTPYNSKGEKDGTSVEMMYKALKSIGYSKQYENIRLICNIYWGWKHIDLSEKENFIIKDYDKVLNVYNKMKKERERSSKINNQYMLWWLLNQNDILISYEDLKFIKTRDTLKYYETIRRNICEKLGWDFIPLK